MAGTVHTQQTLRMGDTMAKAIEQLRSGLVVGHAR